MSALPSCPLIAAIRLAMEAIKLNTGTGFTYDIP
jgi:hypothetical protein